MAAMQEYSCALFRKCRVLHDNYTISLVALTSFLEGPPRVAYPKLKKLGNYRIEFKGQNSWSK